MQIKIFTYFKSNASTLIGSDLEDRVNAWLKKNPAITIVKINMLVVASPDGVTYTTFVVYESNT